MTQEQLQQLPTEEFQDYCTIMYAEQERRARIASIPDEIKRLSDDFENFGGDKTELVAKVNEPTVKEEVKEDKARQNKKNVIALDTVITKE